MVAIETKYFGPTNTKGARLIATDVNGGRTIVNYDHALNSEDNHKRAAIAHLAKRNWQGRLVTGATRHGYVHVFDFGVNDYWRQ